MDSLLQSFQQFNAWVQEEIFDQQQLAPEYSDLDATPIDGFRVNSYGTDEPEIDLQNWSLTVDGMVKNPGEYTFDQIKALPKRSMNTRHVCVEGWSMIPRWGGTPLKGFLEMVGADQSAKYISLHCGDDYYTAYDMRSAMHAQTLLCYEAYGKPLTLQHGAPLRIVIPTKLGYKNAKWIDKLTVTNEKPGGYWEDQGYDWFGGI